MENMEKCQKNENIGKTQKIIKKKEGPKTMLEMTAAKFWAFSIPEDLESVKFWKIRFLGQIPVKTLRIWGLKLKALSLRP